MFNRKKNLKPYYKDYINEATGFKQYLIDSIKYMRKQNVVQAINFDLDGLIAELPDKLEPGDIANGQYNISSKGKALIKQMMNEMGFQLFADMMADMGLDYDDIRKMIKSEQDGTGTPITTPTGKTVPGFNDANPVIEKQRAGEFIYNKTLEVMASMIDDALKVNNPQLLTPIVDKMNSIIAEHGDASAEATQLMQELSDTTRVFIELIDDNSTTVEEYESFQNKLINYFIKDEVDDVNTSAAEEHKEHDPSECEYIQRTNGEPPLQVLYRRIHSMDGTDGNKCEAIPNLSIVVFDTVRGHIVPIAFSLHEAMTEKTGESFITACKSESGTEFLVDTLLKFRKRDEERFDKIIQARAIEMPDGHGAMAAGVVVKPEVITPKASVMRGLLDEVRETFDVDAAEAFADINPEDFLK